MRCIDALLYYQDFMPTPALLFFLSTILWDASLGRYSTFHDYNETCIMNTVTFSCNPAAAPSRHSSSMHDLCAIQELVHQKTRESKQHIFNGIKLNFDIIYARHIRPFAATFHASLPTPLRM